MRLASIYDYVDRYDLLYKLLGERDETVNISHRSMPSWEDHIRFVDSRPYVAWYFIIDDAPVGTCYLMPPNEIGIFILRGHQGKGLGSAAVRELMQRHGKLDYIANINPRNENSRSLFTGLGFNLVQHTYRLWQQ